MKTHRLFRIFLIALLALGLTACQKKEEERVGRYGMLDKGTPEYTAVMFMRSIYMDDTLDVAVEMSSNKMARILLNYHTNRNVQRHLFNLKFDTVDITPQESSRVARSEFAEESTITLFLSGSYNGDKVEDIRSLDLIKQGGEWRVDKIHPDHFL
ncbi:hypothetical protein [Alteromonas sp. CYL-A6]|uniref:hypothetical protein n=1 Tax=Alteromonas nitratireducens TaxID=3390813 RepID=UPI0034AB7AEA